MARVSPKSLPQPHQTPRHLCEDSTKSRSGIARSRIKVLYEPDQLERARAAEGWQAEIDATGWFIFGGGSAAPGRLSRHLTGGVPPTR
jgi:hypothetical protein